MKELIKPNDYEMAQVVSSLCEVDCQCPHVTCNKDCAGSGGGNTSLNEDPDILF